MPVGGAVLGADLALLSVRPIVETHDEVSFSNSSHSGHLKKFFWEERAYAFE